MPENGPGAAVILGAGYAGVAIAHEVRRAGRGKIPIVVVDRHPSHTIRTRLYEVGRLAEADGRSDRWSIPIDRVLSHDKARFVAGEVEAIDIPGRTVRAGGEEIPFATLAICLGNVAVYFGIPGAEEHTEQVYRFAGALHLAHRLRELAGAAATETRGPVRVAVVGGGSTGTEVAAEIATTDWSAVVGRPVPPMEVTLVIGALPFLAGLPAPLIAHAERLLAKAKVRTIPDLNVAKVEAGALTLQDGQTVSADVLVWCAGLGAAPIVRGLSLPHGKGGRIAVTDTLEVPGHPGIFAVGDSAELKDPATGMLVPGTAQAALAEAPIAGRNLVAFLAHRSYASFRYRERGTVVAVGRGAGSGRIAGLTVWGRPAALVKAAVDADYAASQRRGREAPGL